MPTVSVVDPLRDPRWADLVERHPRASVFHSPGWLEALKRTWGYEPFVVTTSNGPRLENGIVVCRVHTWLVKRLVSLPFSDHCDPLVDSPDDLAAMVAFLLDEKTRGRWRSLELRPRPWDAGPLDRTGAGPLDRTGAAPLDRPGAGPFRPGEAGAFGLFPGATYALHTLDLRPSLDEIFRRFHPSCTRRAIRRAEREGLDYECGRSESLLADFYSLFRMTRRRHGVPPQPLAWFRNVLACLGAGAAVHVARHAGRTIAAIVTLRFKQTLVYKYGGSDAQEHRIGAMPFLFWRVTGHAKPSGAEQFDLGRSDLEQPGLVAFKEHLGAARIPLTYLQHPVPASAPSRPIRALGVIRQAFARVPEPLFSRAGRLMYRHLG